MIQAMETHLIRANSFEEWHNLYDITDITLPVLSAAVVGQTQLVIQIMEKYVIISSRS